MRWPAAAAHNNLVYVAGGYNYTPTYAPQTEWTRRYKSYKMWAYDPRADVWLAKPDLPQQFDLACPELNTIGDKLFICSSVYSVTDLDLGVFDVAENNWTKITLPAWISLTCSDWDVLHSFVYDSKVHIFATEGYDRDGDSVITIDSQGNIVTSTEILPRFPNRVVCALVYAN